MLQSVLAAVLCGRGQTGGLGAGTIIAPFDIFKDKEGTLLWCGTAATLEEAKDRVRLLAESDPTDYMIFSQKTGNRIVIQAGGESTRP